MKHYIVKLSTGYAGMYGYDLLSMKDDATQDEIDNEAWLMAVEHAERYGIYPAYYYEDSDEEIDDDSLSDNIEGSSLGEYDPEKHDRYRSGGGSFQDEIARN